ncbi:hypothetical protein [Marinomonas sp. 2405UD68-3]
MDLLNNELHSATKENRELAQKLTEKSSVRGEAPSKSNDES